MSEFTRAQIDALMQRAADAIRQSEEIRRELEAVMKRIEETGYVAHNAQDRKNAAKRTTAK
jgi:predicted  nucleic acid-binding Zn-ribbon protein